MKSPIFPMLMSLAMLVGCAYKGNGDDAIQQQADKEFTQEQEDLAQITGSWSGTMLTDDGRHVPVLFSVYAVTSGDSRDPSGRTIQRADPGATFFSTTITQYSATFKGTYNVATGSLDLNSVIACYGGGGGGTGGGNSGGAAAPGSDQDRLCSLHFHYDRGSNQISGDVVALNGHVGTINLGLDPKDSANSGGTTASRQAEIRRTQYKQVTGPTGQSFYKATVDQGSGLSFSFFLRFYIQDVTPNNPVLLAGYVPDERSDSTGALRRSLMVTLEETFSPPHLSMTSVGVPQPTPGSYQIAITNGTFGRGPNGDVDYGTINATFENLNLGIPVPVVLHRTNQAPPARPGVPIQPPPRDICPACSAPSKPSKPGKPSRPRPRTNNGR